MSTATRVAMTQDTFNAGFAQSSTYPVIRSSVQATLPSRITGNQQLEVWSRPFVGQGSTYAGYYAIVYQIAQLGLTGSQAFVFTYAGTLLDTNSYYTIELPSESTTDPMRSDLGPYTWYDGATPVITYSSTTFTITVPWVGQGGHTTPMIFISTSVPTPGSLSSITGSTFPTIPIWTT